MTYSGLQLILIGLLVSAAAASTAPCAAASEKPARDQTLEARLVRTGVYTTRSGESLESVAYFLYGHRSWWKKIRQWNPSLHSHGPMDILGRGTHVFYRAPEIGSSYTVQPGDWLIRIVQWKYGETEHWEQIYRNNASRIENPNLIHPGDELALDLDGTVRKAATGEVIIQGVPSGTPDRDLATRAQESWASDPRFFYVGFAAGVVCFLLMPAFWLFKKPKSVPDSPEGRDSYLDEVRMKESKVAAPTPDTHSGEGFPYSFKKRPVEEPRLDRSLLIVEKDGEIRQKPGYHSLFGRKKPLKSSKKS